MPGVAQDWQSIYGNQGYGYSPERMRTLFLRGSRDIGEQTELGMRRGKSELAESGFYSRRPMERMVGKVESDRARALSDYRFGLQEQSSQLAEQQKGRLFTAQSAETMQKNQQAFQSAMMMKQHGMDLAKMDKQQVYTLHQMSIQHGYNRNLMEFEKELRDNPGFMDWLGQIVGIGAGVALGGVI